MTTYDRIKKENDKLKQELIDTKRLIRDYVMKRNAGAIKSIRCIVEEVNEIDYNIADKYNLSHNNIDSF